MSVVPDREAAARAEERRYEICVLVGPCSESAAENFAEKIIGVSEHGLGAAVAIRAFSEDDSLVDGRETAARRAEQLLRQSRGFEHGDCGDPLCDDIDHSKTLIARQLLALSERLVVLERERSAKEEVTSNLRDRLRQALAAERSHYKTAIENMHKLDAAEARVVVLERERDAETEDLEAFAAAHGIPALLDHLGLDGLGNEVIALIAKSVTLERERDEALKPNDEEWRAWRAWADTLEPDEASLIHRALVRAAEVRVARLEEAARLALSGIPDPMHPGIPRKFVDKLVAAQIILMDACGHDDPGNVESAREALAGVSVEPQE